MLRRCLVLLLLLPVTFAIGYAVASYRAQSQAAESAKKSTLHRSLLLASICGDELHYLEAQADSKASKYMQETFIYSINNAHQELSSGTTPFYSAGPNVVKGLSRGRDFMLTIGNSHTTLQVAEILNKLGPAKESK